MRSVLLVVLNACGSTPECTPPATNPPECPATWAEARARCNFDSGVGECQGTLNCSYPGMGDLQGARCAAPAVTQCRGGFWVCSQ